MSPFDARELKPCNSELHRQRLNRIKQSVAMHLYQVNPEKVAGGIIREAGSARFLRNK